MDDIQRYGIITGKNSREIVLLRGGGCKHKTCLFCDYHYDKSDDEGENYKLNREVLSQIKGMYGVLEVINSGSFSDLDKNTVNEILKVCTAKSVKTLHIESHWLDRTYAGEHKDLFGENKINVKMKIGIETFDSEFRCKKLGKKIAATTSEIAEYFDECCLLFGISGQSAMSMESDITTGLKYFERICVNIMQDNSTGVKADKAVIDEFMKKIYPKYRTNQRIDILLNNTDFGVGRLQNEQ